MLTDRLEARILTLGSQTGLPIPHDHRLRPRRSPDANHQPAPLDRHSDSVRDRALCQQPCRRGSGCAEPGRRRRVQ